MILTSYTFPCYDFPLSSTSSVPWNTPTAKTFISALQVKDSQSNIIVHNNHKITLALETIIRPRILYNQKSLRSATGTSCKSLITVQFEKMSKLADKYQYCTHLCATKFHSSSCMHCRWTFKSAQTPKNINIISKTNRSSIKSVMKHTGN